MTSPFDTPEDVQLTLKYAPPWARDRAQAAKPDATQPPDKCESRRQHLDDIQAFSGDRAVLDMQARLALQPESVPEPPSQIAAGRSIGRIALQTCGVSGVAAIIAWVIVSAPNEVLPGRDGLQERLAAAPSFSSDQQHSSPAVPALRPDRAAAQPGLQRLATPASEPARPLQPSLVAAATAVEHKTPDATNISPPAQPKAATMITRQIDADEVTSLIARGEELINTGDLSSARLLLRRAAEAGNARAAFALARTFDPNALKALGLRDGAPDLAEARFWYERAVKLGSPDAPQQLQQLATASAQ
jgi:hypothetical protein